MNIGVGVARKYEYWVFRREYEYRFTEKTGFFFHFFHFCNFVFRVQYAVFICLMMHQRSEFSEIIVLQKLNVKTNYLPLSTEMQER